MKNVLDFLEQSADLAPDKTAFTDERASASYSEVVSAARAIGTALTVLKERNRPVAVYLDKSVQSLSAFFGVVYSGNFYVVVDTQMPADRINTIFQTLAPVAVLTDKKNLDKAKELNFTGPLFLYEEAVRMPADEEALHKIRRNMIDTDPLYALFTSGSTGVPKGAVISHRSAISYADWVTEAFGIDENTVFGNQTPFYFSMSVLDIYSTIKNGATLHIIPKKCFAFPLKLLEYLNEKQVNTVYWVPSALCIVANWKAFEYVSVPTLKKVLFAGEVMPNKQLNMLRKELPGVLFANLYGPTEVTDICTYYVVDREFADDEPLPIGSACNNCGVFVLKDDNTQALPGEEGELCVRGSFLAMGYFNNAEKTSQVFVQNPLNPYYPETVYRTGDIVKYNEKGELVYISRKDFQIKHMGYRIELGEIETAVSAVDGMKACACIYDEKKEKIVLIYTGDKLDDKKVMDSIKGKLPSYMLPNKMKKVKAMPYNANGKIDRVWLKNNYQSL